MWLRFVDKKSMNNNNLKGGVTGHPYHPPCVRACVHCHSVLVFYLFESFHSQTFPLIRSWVLLYSFNNLYFLFQIAVGMVKILSGCGSGYCYRGDFCVGSVTVDGRWLELRVGLFSEVRNKSELGASSLVAVRRSVASRRGR